MVDIFALLKTLGILTFYSASDECSNGDIEQRNGAPIRTCEDGKWRYLCGRLWGNAQAAVACKQMGMPGKGETIPENVVVL